MKKSTLGFTQVIQSSKGGMGREMKIGRRKSENKKSEQRVGKKVYLVMTMEF